MSPSSWALLTGREGENERLAFTSVITVFTLGAPIKGTQARKHTHRWTNRHMHLPGVGSCLMGVVTITLSGGWWALAAPDSLPGKIGMLWSVSVNETKKKLNRCLKNICLMISCCKTRRYLINNHLIPPRNLALHNLLTRRCHLLSTFCIWIWTVQNVLMTNNSKCKVQRWAEIHLSSWIPFKNSLIAVREKTRREDSS